MKALRVNTILYCRRWRESVDFYRDVLKLPAHWELDWLVEFELGPATFLSVAAAARTSIPAGEGRGITVSIQVQGLDELRSELAHQGIRLADVPENPRFAGFYAWDPDGNRLEFWQPR